MRRGGKKQAGSLLIAGSHVHTHTHTYAHKPYRNTCSHIHIHVVKNIQTHTPEPTNFNHKSSLNVKEVARLKHHARRLGFVMRKLLSDPCFLQKHFAVG